MSVLALLVCCLGQGAGDVDSMFGDEGVESGKVSVVLGLETVLQWKRD